jgi:hypothetical protein
MTPYIFPGLKQPTSQLFFDLQAMIAENGGRLRLANTLENEAVSFFSPRLSSVTFHHPCWHERDLVFLLSNYEKMSVTKLMFTISKSRTAIASKILKLQKTGFLDYKNHK